jgi:serine phosphatase RsbU (regulator of sigma subunit)
MAARYIPGTGTIGGDWYDVFTVPTGEVCLVIGDVAGSGLHAAVIMGRIRSSLRSYALQSRDPAHVLTLLDRKMQHFEPGAIATVLYAVMEPGLDQPASPPRGTCRRSSPPLGSPRRLLTSRQT